MRKVKKQKIDKLYQIMAPATGCLDAKTEEHLNVLKADFTAAELENIKSYLLIRQQQAIELESAAPEEEPVNPFASMTEERIRALAQSENETIERSLTMFLFFNKHYITIDKCHRIMDGFSDAFRQPSESDICINEQGSYQFRLFPGGEENPSLYNQNGIPLYKWEDEQVLARTSEEIQEDMLPDLETVKATKLTEVDKACTTTIHAGAEIDLPSGAERFSFKPEDQINLKAAIDEVKAGAAGYPYHADGQLCRIYSAADIIAIATALAQHKLYHTTYANHLNVWIRRAADAEELESIVYGADLPTDLATNMQGVLADAQNII